MSERYSKLFSLEENLYTEGSPVIIQAGALQKDNQSGKVLVQLRFKNISEKVIECISVKVTSFDTAGRQLEDVVEYQYLDLHAERDAEFGSKQPIYLSNITTRSFNVSITEVVFSDKIIWQATNAKWDRLQIATPVTISEYFERDFDLIEQYELNMGNSCYCLSEKERDLWICGCDAINHSDEETCHRCGRTFEELMQSLDIDILKKQVDERLALEKQDKIQEQRKSFEQKKKFTMLIKKSFVVAILLFFIVSITLHFFKSYSYNKAVRFVNEGKHFEAMGIFMSLKDYKDSNQQELIQLCTLTEFRPLIASYEVTYGLKSNGTVVATGLNNYGQCNVADWKNIIKISSNGTHIVGLKKDGTVVATGHNGYGQCNVADWNNIVAISTSDWHTVGLKKDGTVVATGHNASGICNVADWNNIVAISASSSKTVGLKKDSTVVAVGWNGNGQCDVADWENISLISANSPTAGLKSDGTVVATGHNDEGQCNVTDWNGIISICTGGGTTIGLKDDGSVVAVGENFSGQCDVFNWTLIEQ